MRKVVPITRGGQISLPAAIRHRWGARKVVVIDEGEQLVIKPVPADLLGALIGKFPLPPGRSLEELTEQWRQEDIDAEERKWREYEGGPFPDTSE